MLLQCGLDEKWWADSMECYCYFRNVRDFLSDETTHYERRFEEQFSGPVISLGPMIEYHPIAAKDKSRLHQFGKKLLLGIFTGYALYPGGIGKKEISWSKTQCEGCSSCRKVVNISYSRWQMEQSSCLKGIRFFENPPQARITLHEAKSTAILQGNSDGTQTETR